MQRLYAWLRGRPLLVDGVFALPLFGLGALQALTIGGPRGLGVLMALALSVAMALHRVRMLTAAVLAVAVGFVQLIGDVAPTMANYAMLVVLYTAAKSGPRWLSRIGLGSVLVVPGLLLLRWPEANSSTARDMTFSYCFIAVILGIAWVLGDSMRTRRAYYAELEERAARLEFERDQQAQIAAAAERARIARELHDVVAHNVSVMVVQADGAAYAIDTAPERAREALGAISATGREALAEMRRLLGVLRSRNEIEAYVPQPGVDQLGDLVERARGAGLDVRIDVRGEPVELSQGLALTAYRIVQEGLTNTRKHAGPDAAARITVVYGGTALEVAISDDGRGADAPGDGMGHGLVGMRERVAMLGGTLRTGPHPGGGWAVSAVLPYSGAASAARRTTQGVS